MKHLMALTTLVAAIVTANPNAAEAHTGPDQIASECAENVRSSVARVQNALADDVNRCVPLIKRLKQAGQIVEARIVARRCIDSINGTTRAGHSYVKDLCERCINRLLDFGAFDLAARLRGFCADALERIEQLGERARNAVDDALNS